MKQRTKSFIKECVLHTEQYMIAKKDILYITDRDDQKEVYLIRYPVFNNSLFGLYIHRFLRSDYEEPHDHPFSFLGYVVEGRYFEKRYELERTESGSDLHYLRESGLSAYREEGTLAYRKATDAHVVKLDQEFLSIHEYKKAPLTVILRGPRFRQWGFWKIWNDTGIYKVAEWIHYTKYKPTIGYRTVDTLGK